jgi:AraC-like DNA-binding protein
VTGSDDLDRSLADVLQSVRLETGFISRAMMRAPFAVHSDGLPQPIFHAVASGSCWFRRDGDDEGHELATGDVVLLTRGHGHVLADAPGRVTVPLSTLPVTQRRSHVDLVETRGSGPECHVLCGSFAFRHPASDALLALLPAHVVVHDREPTVVPWLADTLATLDAELDRDVPGSDVLVTRLVDLLVVHVLRRCVLAARATTGWLSALRDPKIGRALALVHRSPEADWTASSLAARVGMSRSAFFARFTEIVGEPPAQYLTRWRMHVAADLLGDDRLSLGQLAERVGYGSEDAFSKVFKRTMGVSPGQYRRQLRSSVDA